MKKKITVWGLLFTFLLISQFTQNIYGESSGIMDLVGLLSNQLKVTEDQATGGAGSLFKVAKETMSETDYGKVAEALPGIGSLIESAPKISESAAGLSEKLGGAVQGISALSKAEENVNKLAAVSDQFSQLGLDKGMVSQFIPIILNYANSKGGETIMNLLKGVWQ
jgi:hypothetical protein